MGISPCAHHSTSAHADRSAQNAIKRKNRTPMCIDKGASWHGSKPYGTHGYSICQRDDSSSKCASATMQEIYQNGPITGMIFVHQSFLSYKSGVYKAVPYHQEAIQAVHEENIERPYHQDHWLGLAEHGTPYWRTWRRIEMQIGVTMATSRSKGAPTSGGSLAAQEFGAPQCGMIKMMGVSV
ncbi:unnamed protein product [Durusdinium trenchii]|uniref:Peptidase C1A papain C-terminal domain-containing protein n=1 Tax=Durusdinium trenchii TaxID=1381693 RepID=A0ABP0I2U0_9DINO